MRVWPLRTREQDAPPLPRVILCPNGCGVLAILPLDATDEIEGYALNEIWPAHDEFCPRNPAMIVRERARRRRVWPGWENA